MNLENYEAIIESILFVAGEPVSLTDLSNAIEQNIKTTEAIVLNLMDKYKNENRGILIIEIDHSYQMCTNPENFNFVRKLYQNTLKKPLTQPLLETLAIIAYKQPITKAQIEEIRGVNADHAVNKLIEFNLVSEKGRYDAPGKPILFGTTDEFLKYFGFTNLSQLPKMDYDIEQLKKEAEEEISGEY